MQQADRQAWSEAYPLLCQGKALALLDSLDGYAVELERGIFGAMLSRHFVEAQLAGLVVPLGDDRLGWRGFYGDAGAKP